MHTFYIPFLLYVIPICLLHNAFYELGLYDVKYSVSLYFLQILRCFTFSVGTTEPFLPQLWFLKTLFLAEILYSFLHFLCNRLKINSLYLLLLAILFFCFLRKNIVPHVLEVNVIWPIKAWILIEIGRYAKEYENKKWNKYIVVPFVVIWVFTAYKYSFSFQDTLGQNFMLQLMLASLGFFTLYETCCIVKECQLIRITTCYIGKKSLYIFFWHYIAFALINLIYCCLFDSFTYRMFRHKRFLEDISWYSYVWFSIVLVLLGGYIYDTAKKKHNS